ncbi:hypothetical protein ATR1_064d0005 [Acetobacter tropicalis]|nr:hypothetical protein ATR1_064d0005 [Acetobacter tropicalis]
MLKCTPPTIAKKRARWVNTVRRLRQDFFECPATTLILRQTNQFSWQGIGYMHRAAIGQRGNSIPLSPQRPNGDIKGCRLIMSRC